MDLNYTSGSATYDRAVVDGGIASHPDPPWSTAALRSSPVDNWSTVAGRSSTTDHHRDRSHLRPDRVPRPVPAGLAQGHRHHRSDGDLASPRSCQRRRRLDRRMDGGRRGPQRVRRPYPDRGRVPGPEGGRPLPGRRRCPGCDVGPGRLRHHRPVLPGRGLPAGLRPACPLLVPPPAAPTISPVCFTFPTNFSGAAVHDPGAERVPVERHRPGHHHPHP